MANTRALCLCSNSNAGHQFRRRKGETIFDQELDLLVDTLEYFGWIETVGGVLKVCLVLGAGIFMYVIYGKG